MIKKKNVKKAAVVRKIAKKADQNFLQKSVSLLKAVHIKYLDTIAFEMEWSRQKIYRRLNSGKITSHETISIMEAFEKVMVETLDEMRKHPIDKGIIHKISEKL